MFPYLLVIAVLLIPAVLLPQRRPARIAWIFAFLLLLAFVGLRHKVGMDWNNYLLMIRNVAGGSWIESFDYAEPAYATVLWFSSWMGLGIYGANLISSAIFMGGLFRFSKRTPLPWLSLAVAFPFLIVVVAMSANRQAAAIGVLLWLAADWDNTRTVKRIAITLLAALFHLSAIFFLVFAAVGLKIRPQYKVVVIAVTGAAALAYLQLSGGADYYDQSYLSGQSEMTYSAGATQHVLLNGVPALLMFFGKRVREALFPTALSIQLAWLALALVPLSFVFSLAAGRMTLYLFPVSMYALSALPGVLAKAPAKAMARLSIGAILFLIAWAWLSFANSSFAHIPYENAVWLYSWELHL